MPWLTVCKESKVSRITRAIKEVVEQRQVYIEVEEALLIQGSPTLSIVAPIKDDREVVRGVLIADMPSFPGNIGFSFFMRAQGTDYDLELVSGSGRVLSNSAPEQVMEESEHWKHVRHLSQERQSGIVKPQTIPNI